MKKVFHFKDLRVLRKALENFDIESFTGKKVPVKIHMGESKNKFFIRPSSAKEIVEELKTFNVKPYLFDTTVAYSSLRHSKSGYQKLAQKHGFTFCPVIIEDKGTTVTIERREFEVANHLFESTHIFAISHITGHIQAGMGGAIKNFGMGGVTKETKKKIHQGSRPVYNKERCTYCGECADACPFDAIRVEEGKWIYSITSCFGCGVCVGTCNYNALDYKDADIQYLLACSAKACLQGKKGIFLNELKRIARSCDCDPNADPIICPDIGYLISDDPVAVDKASLDLVNKVKENIFEKENRVNPVKQIEYGEKIGLGSSKYELLELN